MDWDKRQVGYCSHVLVAHADGCECIYIFLRRRLLGVAFPVGHYDASAVLIDYDEPTAGKDFKILGFLDPFTNVVWWLIIVATLLTSMLQNVLHHMQETRRHKALDEKTEKGEALFLIAMAFTGNYDFAQATTQPKRILVSLPSLRYSSDHIASSNNAPTFTN